MKILYLMHIEWGWIKQRPHFIAEGLAEAGIEVDVRYETSFRLFKRLKNPSNTVSAKRLIPVPKKRHGIARKVDVALNSMYMYIMHKVFRYDAIWICHPGLIQYVSRIDVPIIYDCMDDHIEFFGNRQDKSFLMEVERSACVKSRTIASSEYLSLKLRERYGRELRIDLVRNGISQKAAQKFERYYSMMPDDDGIYKVLYFGAIAEWFDFSAIEKILDNPNVKVILIGPAEVAIPTHKNLIHTGPMNHDEMMEYAGKADALIMPFRINELILGVDPVKLYEYVCFKKPIFSVYYDEIARFGEFVYFYDDPSNLNDQILKKLPAKSTKQERLKFINDNTWDSRISRIVSIMERND